MSATVIDNPVLNGPFDPPSRHWMLDGAGQLTDDIAPKRRPSESWIPVPRQRKGRGRAVQEMLAIQDELDVTRTGERRNVNDQVNRLRADVDIWRVSG